MAKLKNVTLLCWSQESTGRWAWQLSYGEHSKRMRGRETGLSGERLALHALQDALSRLNQRCFVRIHQYPALLYRATLPLPPFLQPGDIEHWHSSDDRAPSHAALSWWACDDTECT